MQDMGSPLGSNHQVTREDRSILSRLEAAAPNEQAWYVLRTATSGARVVRSRQLQLLRSTIITIIITFVSRPAAVGGQGVRVPH